MTASHKLSEIAKTLLGTRSQIACGVWLFTSFISGTVTS